MDIFESVQRLRLSGSEFYSVAATTFKRSFLCGSSTSWSFFSKWIFGSQGAIGFVNSLLIINPPGMGCHYRAGFFYLMRLSTGCQCKEINYGMMWSLFLIRVMIHAARCLAESIGYLTLDKNTDSSRTFLHSGESSISRILTVY